MSEATPDESKPEAPQHKPHRGLGWYFNFLTFILAIVAFVGMAAIWAQLRTAQKHDSTQSTTAAIQQLQQNVSTLQNHLAQYNDQAKTQDQQITAARKASEALLNKINLNQGAWQTTDAKHLLQMANYTLHFSHNVPTTIALLQTADNRLSHIDESDIFPVRRAIANEIAELNALPKIDVTGIYMQLQALRNQVNQLPSYNNAFKAHTDNYLKQQDPTQKGTVSHGLWHALSKVVVIRRHDKQIEPLLAYDNRLILSQNLNLLFSQAEWSAIQGNQTIFTSSLKQIVALLDHYYNHSSEKASAITKSLNDLEKTPVNFDISNFGSSLKALNAMLKKREEAKQ